MKKSIVATGIIIILAVGYIGTAKYTGTLIEKDIDIKIAELTNQVNNSQKIYNLNITHSNDEKGLFLTKMHLKVTLTPKNETATDESTIKLYDDDITIHHGPFPLVAIANGSFTPQMAWLEFAMTEKTNPNLWKLAGNKSFITGHAGISYGEHLTIKLATKAINATHADFDFVEDKGVFELGKANFTLGSANDLNNLSIRATLDKFNYIVDQNNIISLNELNASFKPELNNSTVDYEVNFGSFKISNNEFGSNNNVNFDNFINKGKFNYDNNILSAQSEINKLVISNSENSINPIKNIEFNKFVMNQKTEMTADDTVDGSLFTSVDSIIYGQQNLGHGSLEFGFKGLDKKIMPDPFYMNNFENEQDITENIPKNMNFTLNKFNWHNSAGDINISLAFDVSNFNNYLYSNIIEDSINTLKLKIEAPFKVIAHLYAQIENPTTNEVTEQQVAKANSNIQLSSKMILGNSPVFVFNNGETDGIYSNIILTKDSDQVQVNDKNMSKEEFLRDF